MNMATSNAFLFLNIYSLLVTTRMNKLEVFIGEKKQKFYRRKETKI